MNRWAGPAVFQSGDDLGATGQSLPSPLRPNHGFLTGPQCGLQATELEVRLSLRSTRCGPQEAVGRGPPRLPARQQQGCQQG